MTEDYLLQSLFEVRKKNATVNSLLKLMIREDLTADEVAVHIIELLCEQNELMLKELVALKSTITPKYIVVDRIVEQ